MEIELDDYAQKISGALARSPCELCLIPSRRLCNTAKQNAMSNDKKTTELPTRSSWMTVQKRSVMLRRSRSDRCASTRSDKQPCFDFQCAANRDRRDRGSAATASNNLDLFGCTSRVHAIGDRIQAYAKHRRSIRYSTNSDQTAFSCVL